jgi:TatD DNase family protein
LFGIFHCFSGTYEQALKAISYNMKLGNRWLLSKKWNDQFLSQIDLKHIVLETDSPYLAPFLFEEKKMKVVTWLIYWISCQIYEISANDI